MIDDLVDRAWSCIHRIVPEKKPPDRNVDANNWSRQNFIKNKLGMRSEKNIEDPTSLNVEELPNIEDLESAFRDFLDELDLSPEKERELNEQSPEKKWYMIMEQNIRKNKTECIGVDACEELMQLIGSFFNEFPDKYSMPLAVQHLESLSISLRTESFSFVQKFLNLGGAAFLVDLLHESRQRGVDCLAAPILSCFRALLNSSIGRNGVLESEEILLAIAGAIDFRNSKCKILSLEILSGLCLVAEGGHTAVLKALTGARDLLGERTRFQRLVDDLHREYDTSDKYIKSEYGGCQENARQRETQRVRIAIMSLVNALLKSGAAEEVIDRLRNEQGSVLEDHFDLFEMMRQEDEQELMSIDSGSSSSVDFESPAGMAEALTNKLGNSIALPHLISVLQHMLMIPCDEKHLHLWRLFDLILQQLSLNVAMGDLSIDSDAQFAKYPLSLDMDKLLDRLRSQSDYEKLEKEIIETHSELENERRRNLELENRISDLQDGVSLSSFSRTSDLSSSPSDPCHSPTFLNSTNSFNGTAQANLPPVKPPPFLAPPPPPPTAQELRSGTFLKDSVPQKKVPKPNCSLKTLNWTVLPTNRIAGTVWEKIEDEKLYKQIDLQELASSFASASKNADELDGTSTAANTLQRRIRGVESLITVIDVRRAQNCTIMLSKLKLSHREIRSTVMSMDERGKLPKDMIEQMMKFVPTKEEIAMLHDAVQRHKTPTVLALADRFLYEMSQISRYEQRLKCLYTIRTFHERLDELSDYLNTVILASATLYNNKKLKQFLALILAIGNFLNYGKRNGNAQGFKISSLSAIQTVKSSLRSDRNLMHFIVDLTEKKFPDLLWLKRDLTSIYLASKFNRGEMEAEFHLIERSLRDMVSELLIAEQNCNQQSEQKVTENGTNTMATDESLLSSIKETVETNPSVTKINGLRKLNKNNNTAVDCFVPVVKAFLESAQKSLKEIQILHREMDEKFSLCTKFYADADENAASKKNSPDEFFDTFAKCFNQFTECYQTIWREREEDERAKRQTLVRSIFAKKGNNWKGRKRTNLNKDFETLVSALQSGELFSDDLSRLRTSIRIYHGNGRQKPKSPIPSPPTEPHLSQQQQQHSQYGTTKVNINMPSNGVNFIDSERDRVTHKNDSCLPGGNAHHQKTMLII